MIRDRIRASEAGYIDHATMALLSERMSDLCRDYPDLLSNFYAQDIRGNWPAEFQRYDKGRLESWLESFQWKLEARSAAHPEGRQATAETVLLIHGIRDFDLIG
jgi:hypothetical protein